MKKHLARRQREFYLCPPEFHLFFGDPVFGSVQNRNQGKKHGTLNWHFFPLRSVGSVSISVHRWLKFPPPSLWQCLKQLESPRTFCDSCASPDLSLFLNPELVRPALSAVARLVRHSLGEGGRAKAGALSKRSKGRNVCGYALFLPAFIFQFTGLPCEARLVLRSSTCPAKLDLSCEARLVLRSSKSVEGRA